MRTAVWWMDAKTAAMHSSFIEAGAIHDGARDLRPQPYAHAVSSISGAQLVSQQCHTAGTVGKRARSFADDMLKIEALRR